MNYIKCTKCGELKRHQAKGLCTRCYRRYSWKPKLITCKRCGNQRPQHAKGLCGGCYQSIFRNEENKAYNYKKWYGLDLEVYKRITSKCKICDFDKIIDLHHLDGNHQNNSEDNLIGLCPNHHKMIHDQRFREEVNFQLKNQRF